MDWLEVGDRVFARRYRFFDQQIGLVLGHGEALVVDTRISRVQAREILEDVRLVTRDPVTVVVNTHWHSDHAFGNHEFRPAVIWGHERCSTRLPVTGPKAIAGLSEAMPEIAADLAEVVLDPPDRTFEAAATAEVGDREVLLDYLGLGHTDADIVVRVPDAEVLFAGDLLEAGAVPYFGDSYPIDWPATVERLLPLVTGAVVPGHGEVGDAKFVEAQLSDFRQLLAVARDLHDGRLDRDVAIDRLPYPPEAAAQPLDRALAQLRGELVVPT